MNNNNALLITTSPKAQDESEMKVYFTNGYDKHIEGGVTYVNKVFRVLNKIGKGSFWSVRKVRRNVVNANGDVVDNDYYVIKKGVLNKHSFMMGVASSGDDDNDNTDNDSTTTNTSINAIDEPVEMHDVDDELIDKPVRKLTKNEREKLMREYADGIDNKYYKVMKMKNGQMRITKRSNPLVDADTAHETVSDKIDTRFGKRLTNDQLLLEHIIDLEKRYEVMRMKHKKLKKRYNKLEQDIFDSESDDEIGSSVTEVRYDETPVEQPNRPRIVPAPAPQTITAQPRPSPGRRPIGKPSWRSIAGSF